jgi:predicted enzyme related to lactoylglutathione lyase
MLPKNVISWFQIPTLDFARALKFYSTILGNEIKVMDFNGQTMGFFPMSGDMQDVGGNLMPPMPDNIPSKSGTTVFLACDGQLDEVIARVVPAGGAILMPKGSLGEPGFVAVIQDTEGNRVGLHSKK